MRHNGISPLLFQVLHDHIAYRFEVLEVIGKGSFGQVLKCLDHKNNELVAIKMIRNKKRYVSFKHSSIYCISFFIMSHISQYYYTHITITPYFTISPQNVILCQIEESALKINL